MYLFEHFADDRSKIMHYALLLLQHYVKKYIILCILISFILMQANCNF